MRRDEAAWPEELRRAARGAELLAFELPGGPELRIEALRSAARRLVAFGGVAGLAFVHDEREARFALATSARRLGILIAATRQLARARGLTSGYALPREPGGGFLISVFPQAIGQLVRENWLEEHALEPRLVAPAESVDEARRRHHRQLRPCWPCLYRPSRLDWLWFCAPRAHWHAGLGAAGWLTRCPNCRAHVSRFDEIASIAWPR